MGYLGVPYRLVYISKAFSPGLTDVMAIVLKPDLSSYGPVMLVGIPTAGFSGSYYYDYVSSINDPEGEYIVSTLSSSENVRDITRFTLEKRPVSSGVTVQPLIQPILIAVSTQSVMIQPEISPDVIDVNINTTEVQVNTNTYQVNLGEGDHDTDTN